MSKHYDRYKRHSVAPDNFDKFMEICRGACCICGARKPFGSLDTGKFPDLFIDHAHDTGVIRGLLCSYCNSALGYLGDSAEKLKAAEAYLLAAPALLAASLAPDAPQRDTRPELPVVTKGRKGVAIDQARVDLIKEYYGPYTLRELGSHFGHSPVVLREAMAASGVPIQTKGTLYAGGRRESSAARRYGMGVQQRQELLQRCNGACMCCGDVPEPTKKFPELVVDHDHATGDIRGMVCWKCNLALGHFKDSVVLIRAARSYLAAPPLAGLQAVSASALPALRASSSSPIVLLAALADLEVFVVDQDLHDVDSLQAGGLSHPAAVHALEHHSAARAGRVMYLWRDEVGLPGVQRMLKHKAGESVEKKVFARDCAVQEIDSTRASIFYKAHHLQGTPHATGLTLGLLAEGEIVAAMSFNDPRVCRGMKASWLLQRFACSCRVPGGASRLLAAFRKEHQGSIISYSDNRYAAGGLYGVLGFQCLRDEKPDYRYWRDGRWYSKGCKQRKHLIRELSGIFSPEDTEFTMARRLGYKRVYDCGKKTWLLP